MEIRSVFSIRNTITNNYPFVMSERQAMKELLNETYSMYFSKIDF